MTVYNKVEKFKQQEIEISNIKAEILGSFRFDCLLKFETKTDIYNMVFNAHSESILLFI